MSEHSNSDDPFVTAASRALMIPGGREARVPLTRFAASSVAHAEVDVTMDAAGLADRRREGGGAPGGRRGPAGVSRWGTLLERLGVRRAAPLRAAPVTPVRTLG